MRNNRHWQFQNLFEFLANIKFFQSFRFYFLIIVGISALQACKVADSGKYDGKTLTDQPLAVLGNDTIPAGDFIHAYQNNHVAPFDTSGTTLQSAYRDSVNQYLDLYLDFRLKLKAARDSGMHKTESFQEELAEYREQLADPYLTETQIKREMIREAYQHLQHEVNASHILIRVDEDASPEDTLAAYRLLDSLRGKIIQGASFEEMARKYSDDPSASDNGGELGYFTAFQMVYPFEKKVFNLKEGQISEPFRSRFGYHIVKLNDKRPARDRVKVAHIMIRNQGQNNEQSNTEKTPKERITDIYRQLENGADWNKLCRKHSEDPSTKNKGGSLPYISTGMMVDSFEEAAYGLQEEGAISKPVQTPYGWHILKLEDRKPLPEFEEMKSRVERQISESSRSDVIDRKVINELKKKLSFESYDDSLSGVLQSITSKQDRDTLVMDEAGAQTTLFKINTEKYKGEDFLSYFLQQYDLKNTEKSPSKDLLESYYTDFVANRLKNYERNHLKAINPEYKNIIEEYKNGILLFNIMEQQVWTKASKDTTGLYNFFRNHYQRYNTKKRIVATIFSGKNQSVINNAYQETGNFSELLPGRIVNSLEEKFNQGDDNRFEIIQGNYSSDSINHYDISGVLKAITWEEGQYMIEYKNRKYQVHIHQMIPEGVRNLENVKGLVMEDYQKYLEEKWMEDLRKRYPVKVEKAVLDQIIEKIDN